MITDPIGLSSWNLVETDKFIKSLSTHTIFFVWQIGSHFECQQQSAASE
jgi:hypothetical protein